MHVVPILALLVGASPAWAETPDPKQVLANLGFPSEAYDRVMAGEFVTGDVTSSNERELATAIAFFVKAPPKEFMADMRQGMLQEVDENALSHGEITSDGGVADFAGLKLGDDEVKAYRNAAPGDDLNLSAERKSPRGSGSASAGRATAPMGIPC